MLVIEGGGVAEIWEHEAQKQGIACAGSRAEDWRERLLCRVSVGPEPCKDVATGMAERVIAVPG